jgi:tetratricopeptide (TPR) repeat protein
VSEDFLLKEDRFKGLRDQLLKSASDFYEKLSAQLKTEADLRSRRGLSQANYDVAELANKVGRKEDALAIHRRVLAVRETLASAPGSDPSTAVDVAKSLLAVGHALEATGKTAEALSTYERARSSLEKSDGHPPEGAAAQLVYADAAFMLGQLLRTIGRGAESFRAFEEARDIQATLAAADPHDNDRLSALARSHNEIANLARGTGKTAEALASYEAALAIRQKQVESHPADTDFQRELAVVYRNIGLLLADSGKPKESYQAYQRAMLIRQKLADANPAVTCFQRDLADIHLAIGGRLAETGRSNEAMAAYRIAMAIDQKLVESNPADPLVQYDLAKALHGTGVLLALEGKSAEALQAYRNALAIEQKLVDANAGSFRSILANTQIEFGRFLARSKRFAEAFAALDAGLANNRKLSENDPQNTGWQHEIARSYAYRGGARIVAGHFSQAAADLRLALALWVKFPNPICEAQFELSRVLALLTGLGKHAESGVSAAEAATFADQAVAPLREAIKGEVGVRDELKQPDFDPLRDRADFKQLVAELGKDPSPR